VSRHVRYIGRRGERELETDGGDRLRGKGVERLLIEDLDVDLDDRRWKASLSPTRGRKPPMLVHNLTLSMPAGTPAQAVLAAARSFSTEEFALKHRYAFVLHTDELHPRVHAMVKAVSEQAVRLHIENSMLQRWRQDFARHLRAQGAEANAIQRAVRGENRVPKLDSIYRAARHGSSTHMRQRAEAVACEL
jgi:hypothetical protein